MRNQLGNRIECWIYKFSLYSKSLFVLIWAFNFIIFGAPGGDDGGGGF